MKKNHLFVLLILLTITNFLFAQIELDEHIVMADFQGACSIGGADFDGDGDADFVVTSSGGHKIGWFENDGNQNFSEHIVITGFTGARALDVADMDADNDPDFVATAFNANKISWFENDGSGNFTERVVTSSLSGPSFVIVTDMDDDNDADLLVTACNSGQVVWYENDGNENFIMHQIKTAWEKANCAFPVDLDDDNDMDVIATAKAGEIIWFENDGDENFSEILLWDEWESPNSVQAADLDKDGDIDFAVTSCQPDSKVAWFENDGDEFFSYHLLRENFNSARAVCISDITNDSLPDILAIAWVGAVASVFENNGDKTFTETEFCTTAYDLLKLYPIDLDKDTDLDLLGATFHTGGATHDIRWWENMLYRVKFGVNQNSGQIPLTLQFTDLTNLTQPITTWKWDFNNDGVIDSFEQNPEWTYDQPGVYTVSLEVQTDSIVKTVVYENYISVFDGESAIELDGSDSHCRFLASTSLSLDGAFTFESWILPYTLGQAPGVGFGRIIDKEKFVVYLTAAFSQFQDSSLVVEIKHLDGATSKINTPVNSVTVNTWQHIAVAYNGVDEMKIYINGISQVLNVVNPVSGNIADNSDIDLLIGDAQNFQMGSFDGKIDEVRIWKK